MSRTDAVDVEQYAVMRLSFSSNVCQEDAVNVERYAVFSWITSPSFGNAQSGLMWWSVRALWLTAMWQRASVYKTMPASQLRLACECIIWKYYC